MGKEFDKWNEIKKFIHEKPDNFGVHEREIWWVSFGINIGVEIDGKSESFERPALILKKFNLQMACVLPATSRGKDPRFYEKFLFENKEYFIVLTQPRTISTKRFVRKIGMISKGEFDRIKTKLVGFLQAEEGLNKRIPPKRDSRRPKP